MSQILRIFPPNEGLKYSCSHIVYDRMIVAPDFRKSAMTSEMEI